MTHAASSIDLADKYRLEEGRAYLTGIQALVRVGLDRIRLDRRQGLKTGGFVSGYRGSPVGGLDQQLVGARKLLDAHDIVFVPGVNEELAATAVWGTQKVDLAGRGSTHQGVFGMWYGKAPGVDRAGDAFRHANASGTARYGGCLAIAGDDHLAKSSTVACQSEFAFADLEMPILNPADLQDVLDYGLHGLEMSRWSGLWTAMIALADTMDSSGIVDVGLGRHRFMRPVDVADPRGDHDLNKPILLSNRLEFERSVREKRLPAAKAYIRANGLDGVRFGSRRPRIGFVATGKAYRDLRQALALIGIDEARAGELGIAIYKVAMSWPLESHGISTFARGLEKLVVVEHKRGFMEPQIKEILYHWPEHMRPEVWGKTTPGGAPLFSSIRELSASDIVPALMTVLPAVQQAEDMRAAAQRLVEQAVFAAGHATDARRSPYFCSGCPHSTSTKTPDGARAMPGIGCHTMTELAERTTDGIVAMGGEGAPWIGQEHFSKDGHMFANLGDGTFFHSGSLAIRQAVAAKAHITYKILFNDAVAMTGGQTHDGPLSPQKIAHIVRAEGVERIAIVTDHPESYDGVNELPAYVDVHHRDELIGVQEELAAHAGVSVMIYDQTCAAEKRRRRKKGTYPDPAMRLFVNDRVCEDCGDCSVQSNCVSVEPLETDFGRKRHINQSSCNKDYSCAGGFCPSFVWVDGATVRRAAGGLDPHALLAGLPDPAVAPLEGTMNLLIAGIGGNGVTTVAAVLAMAAHVDGIETLTLDMTGLAQKGGPVTSHVRFAPAGATIEGPRVPIASLDVLIAADMLVAAGGETLAMMHAQRTSTVANGRVAPTAEFVRRQVQSFEAARLKRILEDASRGADAFDAAGIAEQLFGDAIYANMMLIGFALQKGLLPLTPLALETALQLNGASVMQNIAAVAAGRALAADPERVMRLVAPRPEPKHMALGERIGFLADELTRYQDAAYAARFQNLIGRVAAAERAAMGGGEEQLTRTVAEALYKAMAVKDEYEVARLYVDPAFTAKVNAEFERFDEVRVMLAPPSTARLDPATGRPKKKAYGIWVFHLFEVLARLRRIRGTWADPFGRTAERKAERAWRETVFADVERILGALEPGNHALMVEIAAVALEVKGYGPIKEANLKKAEARREALWSRFAATRDAATAVAAE